MSTEDKPAHNYALPIKGTDDYKAAAALALTYGYHEYPMCSNPHRGHFWLCTTYPKSLGSQNDRTFFPVDTHPSNYPNYNLTVVNTLAELEQILRQIAQKNPTTQEIAAMALKKVTIVRRTLSKDNKVSDKIVHTSEPISNAADNGMLIATAASIAPALKDIPADELFAFIETLPEAK